ncbi:hypothetical protein PIROE2DRAFT_9653 [Piromyces sp. E2]|nr:hypothetical protein PIROE2DRAFT_9653 [Piromyces sp. E2]|eukprot:OUM63716.1 hypothetical protein PIROE2DRAFT_9653 [Piromyces sp. E2]
MFVNKDNKNYYVCTTVSQGPGNCIAYGDGQNGGYTCEGGAETIHDCVDHNGQYSSYHFGAILDATDPFRCDWYDKIFKTGNCNPPKVNIKTNKCYNSPVSNSNRKTLYFNLNGKYEYIKEKNGYYLTKYGWCKNNNDSSNNPVTPSPYCRNDSYECKRCIRKLPKVEWSGKKSGKYTLIPSNIDKFCNRSNCQKAYNDNKSCSSSRKDYWKSCKKDIIKEALNDWIKDDWSVVSSTENYC